MVSRLLSACLVAALLAGCATPRDPAPSPTVTGAAAASAAPSTPGDSPVAPAAPVVQAVTLYLAANGGLEDAPPAAGGVTVGFAPSGLAGEPPIATFTGAPLPRPVQVTQEVRATLWVQADLPMPSNHQFDLGLWIGSARATPLFTAATLPAPAVAPGTPVRFDLRLPFGDLAPLVLAAGDSFVATLIVGGDYGAGTSRLLVGGEHPSQLNLSFEELASDPLAAPGAPVQETHEGTLLAPGGGPSCAGSLFTAPIKALANLTYLEAHVEGSGVGGTDLDLSILDGDRVLSGGSTPRAEEAAFLAGPAAKAFSGKTLTLRVVACTGIQDTFRATVRQA